MFSFADEDVIKFISGLSPSKETIDRQQMEIDELKMETRLANLVATVQDADSENLYSSMPAKILAGALENVSEPCCLAWAIAGRKRNVIHFRPSMALSADDCNRIVHDAVKAVVDAMVTLGASEKDMLSVQQI
jgi:hypothetical protein